MARGDRVGVRIPGVAGRATGRRGGNGGQPVEVGGDPSGRFGQSFRGFVEFEAWVSATRDAVLGCACLSGCPACVQSPKCGNGNEPLDKAGAVTVLSLALARAAPADTAPATG